MSDRPTAIILGARFPALGVIASLAAQGVRCVVCDARRLQAAWSLRARFRKLTDPRQDDAAALDGLITIVRAEAGSGPPVVIPTDDHFARLLAANEAVLTRICRPVAAPLACVDLISDQQAFCQWAGRRGYSTPATTDATQTDPDLPFPAIMKPRNFSRFLLSGAAQRLGVRPTDLRFTMLRDRADLTKAQGAYADLLPEMVLQEYLPGVVPDMYSIGLYIDPTGGLGGIFVGRKLRGYPFRYGNTILGQNDIVPETVLAEVRAIVADLGLRGFAEFEYRRSPDSGAFRLIEINPRCWSWIVASRYSPADIAHIGYRDQVGAPLPPAAFNQTPGTIKTVRVMPDLVNVFWRYRADAPEAVIGPVEWWRSLAAERLGLVEFQGIDPFVPVYCALLTLRDLVRNEA